IASRQNVLALLLHEQCHCLAFKSRYGDKLCNLTVAYPLLVSVENYRAVHLAHHQHYFTEDDPDYLRKQGKEWTFPQEAAELLWTLGTDFFGLNVWRVLRAKHGDPRQTRTKAHPRWLRVCYYVLVAGILTWTECWGLFLLYWILPLFTVLQVLVRWGAICE